MMPIYVYRCTHCGSEIEKNRSIAARDEYVGCYNCNNPDGETSLPMERIITPVHGRIDAPADGSKPKHYGGPDQFTADAMGIPKKELLEDPKLSGLRNDGPGVI